MKSLPCVGLRFAPSITLSEKPKEPTHTQNILDLHVDNVLLQPPPPACLPLCHLQSSEPNHPITKILFPCTRDRQRGSRREAARVDREERHRRWGRNCLCGFLLKAPACSGGPGKLAGARKLQGQKASPCYAVEPRSLRWLGNGLQSKARREAGGPAKAAGATRNHTKQLTPLLLLREEPRHLRRPPSDSIERKG